MAAFAGLLDGRQLWVAVEARPGRLALRAEGAPTRELLALPSTADDDRPAFLSARLDLAALPGPGTGASSTEADATYDVVVVPPGGRAPVAVWTQPLPARAVPPAADGHTQYRLVRAPEGHLQVRRTRLPDAAVCERVHAAHDSIELLVRPPPTYLDHDATPSVALLAEDGEVLGSWTTTAEDPAEPSGGLRRVVLTVGPVADAPAQVTRVVVGRPERWCPVRRRGNDVAQAGRAVPLPQIDHAGSDDPQLRLRWSDQGLLQARLFAADPGPDPGPDTGRDPGPDPSPAPDRASSTDVAR